MIAGMDGVKIGLGIQNGNTVDIQHGYGGKRAPSWESECWKISKLNLEDKYQGAFVCATPSISDIRPFFHPFCDQVAVAWQKVLT